MNDGRNRVPHAALIAATMLASYILSFFVFAHQHHTAGIHPTMHITMPVWRLDDTPVNRALMFVFTPMRKVTGCDSRVEWF